MGRLKKSFEVIEVAVTGVDGKIVGDVISVIAQGRGKERHQPDGIDTEFLKMVELLGQAAEIADAVAVGVEKCADVDLVDDCVLVPELVLRRGQSFFSPVTSYAK